MQCDNRDAVRSKTQPQKCGLHSLPPHFRCLFKGCSRRAQRKIALAVNSGAAKVCLQLLTFQEMPMIASGAWASCHHASSSWVNLSVTRQPPL